MSYELCDYFPEILARDNLGFVREVINRNLAAPPKCFAVATPNNLALPTGGGGKKTAGFPFFCPLRLSKRSGKC